MDLHFVRAVRDSSSSHGGASGSVGMLFVVLVIIIVLGLVAGIVARICGGRHLAGRGEYDFEGWVEHKCASCIDGSIPLAGPLPPLPPAPEPPSKEEPKPADAVVEDTKLAEEPKGDDGGGKKEESPAPTSPA